METLEKPLNAKVKVLKEEDCEITYSVELPKDDVQKETEDVYKSIQSRASLPGFRVGKAPLEMVKKNFADRAKQQVLENLIGRAASQVIREKKLQMIDQPKVEKIEFDFEKPLVFHMKVERDPDIKVKDYKGHQGESAVRHRQGSGCEKDVGRPSGTQRIAGDVPCGCGRQK